jgi:hypothetical protein
MKLTVFCISQEMSLDNESVHRKEISSNATQRNTTEHYTQQSNTIQHNTTKQDAGIPLNDDTRFREVKIHYYWRLKESPALRNLFVGSFDI